MADESQGSSINVNISQPRVGGDQVHGDNIRTGDIAQSSGVAVGRQASAIVTDQPQRVHRSMDANNRIMELLSELTGRVIALEVEMRHMREAIHNVSEAVHRRPSGFGPMQWWIVSTGIAIGTALGGYLLARGGQ